MSIEEAWKTLAELAGIDGAIALEDAEDVARTLMLAVLDEAYTYDQKHNHATPTPDCCDYHALRKRIEALK